ncbi:MAG: cation:proton antiporter, partial [Erysipelotrichaceae bacterium]|nr:cation:proton antiporter [Erysipelotrichaceae bacterium]
MSFLGGLDQASAIIASIALMLFGGYIFTRITSWLHLPAVTGYICCGILLGSFGLNLIPQKVIDGMGFLPDIAVAFVAFSTGQFFRIDALKKNGPKVILIAFLETFLASACVFAALSFLGIGT